MKFRLIVTIRTSGPHHHVSTQVLEYELRDHAEEAYNALVESGTDLWLATGFEQYVQRAYK